MEKEFISKIENFPDKFKLSGQQVLPVLKAIERGEPNRNRVESEVMKLFPNKKSRSVFRGMAVPTTVNLKLARSTGSVGTNLFLSPNGNLVVKNPNEHREVLRNHIKDFLVFDFGIFKENVEYFEENSNIFRERDGRAFEIFGRFKRHYIDFFKVSLPSVDNSDELLKGAYKQSKLIESVHEVESRHKWIRNVMPKNQMLKIENLRWKMIKWLSERGIFSTTWVVDSALLREWNSEDSIIELWEGTVEKGKTKLKSKKGILYDGAILRG